MKKYFFEFIANSRRDSGRTAALSLFIFMGAVSASASGPQTSPTAIPGSISPAHKRDMSEAVHGVKESVPSLLPSPAAVPEKITAADSKLLLKEFQKAQSTELKALEHRHKLELKELKAASSLRQKEWEKREEEARHKFFAEHTRGPDRRGYIKDFMERRKVFQQLLKDEGVNRAHEQDVRLKAMKQDQASRLKEFQTALGRGERPSQSLWPRSS